MQCRVYVPVLILMVSCLEAASHPWLEQIGRLEVLAKQCEQHHHKVDVTSEDLDHILVDHKHKFLYCYVPKVACTNWKRLLMVLTGRSNATNVVSIPASLAHDNSSHLKLSDIPSNQLPAILKNYTLFVMVRHPFERLLSAYRNKLEDNQPSAKYFQSVFGRYIVRNYRNNATARDLRMGDNVTFKEFVRYLLAEGVDGAAANEHWRSAHSLCRPCDLDYTFVGKYENFAEDTQAVLELIAAPKLTFPQTRSGGTGNRLRAYFRQLDLDDIKKLYLLYEKDFKLFGYTSENVLGYDFG